MSSFLDHLPSNERESIRRRMRSPEAYEALRERVKGPEDLERELKRSEGIAELRLAMEIDPKTKEAVRKQVEKDIQEFGSEAVQGIEQLSSVSALLIKQGRFEVAVDHDQEHQQDLLVVVPEGNVQEKIPLMSFFSDKYVAQFVAHEKERKITLFIDGHRCGEVSVPVTATPEEIKQAVKSHRFVIAKLKGRPVKRYDYLEGGNLELSTK